MRLKAALPVAVVLVVLFAAPSGANALPKACDLLTAQGAASLLGGPAGLLMDGGVVCGYSAKSGGGTATFSLSEGGATDANLAMMTRDIGGGGYQKETISGLGDQCVYVVRTGDHLSLTVFYHKNVLVLSVVKKATPEIKAAMIQSMKQMLAKF
jgi:hypothetical protein